jgi:endonuclease/exonuclease/phosphatase family metal-dependent hydrolase
MGVDGWGRPYDVVAACAALDADVLVLQESWDPDGGGPSTAERVGAALGLAVVHEEPLAHARVYAPLDTGSSRWAPRFGSVRKTLRLDLDRWKRPAGPADRPFERGRWGVALLARVPVADVTVLPLGRLRRDPATRAVVRGTVDLGGRPVTVLGTHMSHITHGSAVQYRRLAALLPRPDEPAVLCGDMNLWGPPVSSFFPTWRRAVRGRTWPTWHPHSQLDHVLITPALSVVDARVAPHSGSDHRPVVVTLALA